jgi:hypothetical protein
MNASRFGYPAADSDAVTGPEGLPGGLAGIAAQALASVEFRKMIRTPSPLVLAHF